MSPGAEFAAHYGLRRMGAPAPAAAYTRDLWRRRHFIWTFSRARVDATYSSNRLGQAWQIINPLLQSLVYFVIFGVILQTSAACRTTAAFLVIGVFVFSYTSGSVNAGARSIVGNLGLVRALHFPRAVLPIATTLQQLLTFAWSAVVMVAVVLVMGEPLTWWWLLLPARAGAADAVQPRARLHASPGWGRRNRDITNVLPFLMRLWFYLSGVFYSIQVFTERFPEWVGTIMKINPGAVYIELARDVLLDSYQSLPWAWAWATGWAVVAFAVGFVYFWRAEASYGRG